MSPRAKPERYPTWFDVSLFFLGAGAIALSYAWDYLWYKVFHPGSAGWSSNLGFVGAFTTLGILLALRTGAPWVRYIIETLAGGVAAILLIAFTLPGVRGWEPVGAFLFGQISAAVCGLGIGAAVTRYILLPDILKQKEREKLDSGN